MSPARFLRTVQLALKSLLLHKLRSGLTMLGIVFGVFSVIAMLAIGEGASEQAQRQVLELGATNIICLSVKPPEQASTVQQESDAQTRYGLTRSDLALLEAIPTVTRVIPIREVTEEARVGERTMNVRVVGCTPDYFEVNHLNLASGRLLTEADGRHFSMNAVIADEVARELFRHENPLGQTIECDTQFLIVVGVTRRRTASAAIGGSLSGQDYNKDIYVSRNTLMNRIVIGGVDVQRRVGSFSYETVEFNQITLQVASSDEVEATADAVRETLDLKHKAARDVDVVVPKELLEQARQLRNIFNVVLGSIAAISLVVGGIGIMNIMLATVTERTREIGIRRAIGAKQSDITEQFLTETMVLSGTGGAVGVLLGLLTPVIFKSVRAFVNSYVLQSEGSGGGLGASELGRIFSNMEPSVPMWSLPLAFGFSVAVGIVFGLYPARAAARLDPIEALRHE